MRMAYFDQNGRTILIAEMQGMGAPDSAVYAADAPVGTSANDIYYDVATAQVTLKSDLDLVLSRNTISNIPQGATVIHPGGDIVVEDGSIEIVADIESVIYVYVDHPHYKGERVQLEVGP